MLKQIAHKRSSHKIQLSLELIGTNPDYFIPFWTLISGWKVSQSHVRIKPSFPMHDTKWCKCMGWGKKRFCEPRKIFKSFICIIVPLEDLLRLRGKIVILGRKVSEGIIANWAWHEQVGQEERNLSWNSREGKS